jgi:hypothetical protein
MMLILPICEFGYDPAFLNATGDKFPGLTQGHRSEPVWRVFIPAYSTSLTGSSREDFCQRPSRV